MKQRPRPVGRSGLRKCRYCGKKFQAGRSYEVCCSWPCLVNYKKLQQQLASGDERPGG